MADEPPIALESYQTLAERFHMLGPTKAHNAYYDRPVEECRFGSSSEPVEVRHYRRPLGRLFTALESGGFMLERFLEPRPTPDFEQVDPQEYAKLMRSPGFLCVRARKASL